MPDRLFQFARAAVDLSPDLFFRQQRKETFYQADPRAPVGVKCT